MLDPRLLWLKSKTFKSTLFKKIFTLYKKLDIVCTEGVNMTGLRRTSMDQDHHKSAPLKPDQEVHFKHV